MYQNLPLILQPFIETRFGMAWEKDEGGMLRAEIKNWMTPIWRC